MDEDCKVLWASLVMPVLSRTEEQIVDVPDLQFQNETVRVITRKQIVSVPVLLSQEEIEEAVQLVPQEPVQNSSKKPQSHTQAVLDLNLEVQAMAHKRPQSSAHPSRTLSSHLSCAIGTRSCTIEKTGQLR